MYCYCLYEKNLYADIELPQLPEGDSAGKADVLIMEGDIPQEIIAQTAERKYMFGNDRSWISNRTCILLVEEGRKITYYLKPEGQKKHLVSYMLGFGMAMLAQQLGELAMHCSVVADEKGAILIAGESGAGKSTVTTALLEAGYQLMADDMTFVEASKDEPPVAKPAFPYQKLCRDAALQQGFSLEELIYINEDKDKFLVPYRGAFSKVGKPIRAFIMLTVGEQQQVERIQLDGLNKFYACAENLFLRHLLRRDKYAPAIGQACLQMAAKIPIYVVSRPAEKNTSAEVIAEVLDIAAL